MFMATSKEMVALLFIAMVLVPTTLAPASACGASCSQPRNHHAKSPPKELPPYVNPPVIGPPAVLPSPTGGGGFLTPPDTSPAKCSLDILKLGLCVDVLGGLVHVGLGNPAENACCPVLQGLLELEAAACLCSAIKLRVLSLDIYIPLALQVLVTCGKDPPPGYLCPLN